MEITPHGPSMNYTVNGFPLSSEDAFKVFSNGLEINSLTTNNKTIVGAINEIKNDIVNIDLSDYLTKDEAEETYAKITDLSDYATKTEFNTLSQQVTNIDTRVGTLETNVTSNTTDITNIFASLNNVLSQLPNYPIEIVQDTFTNPAYFTQKEKYLLRSTPYSVDLSYVANVLQDIDLTDGTIEIVNINLSRDDVDIDFNGTPRHFYIPATVDFFDTNGDYASSQQITLDAEITTEMNSYDISVYFTGVISNTNQYTAIKFSDSIPYTGVNRTPEQNEVNPGL